MRAGWSLIFDWMDSITPYVQRTQMAHITIPSALPSTAFFYGNVSAIITNNSPVAEKKQDEEPHPLKLNLRDILLSPY